MDTTKYNLVYKSFYNLFFDRINLKDFRFQEQYRGVRVCSIGGGSFKTSHPQKVTKDHLLFMTSRSCLTSINASVLFLITASNLNMNQRHTAIGKPNEEIRLDISGMVITQIYLLDIGKSVVHRPKQIQMPHRSGYRSSSLFPLLRFLPDLSQPGFSLFGSWSTNFTPLLFFCHVILKNNLQ